MDATDRKIIDTSLEQLRTLHQNIGQLWPADTLAAFYYEVLSGTIARHGPEVAQAISAILSEKFDNATKAHASLGQIGMNGTADNTNLGS
ncbi:hypothetical protein [Hymenobacter cellulosivorans]|uniref:Uncharacterized protein n=1 Tax=Hymenobacter cellulosivorans TaxID=2932249 RepID=A0ABY4F5D1_9BACT|nr:hypothetical protein [Hymenobacter cellulosivorans]UOQ51780.1 hypothetical protein MUN80_18700 [Hymenobacter cellulosivorans]